jgi:hypothetical protein
MLNSINPVGGSDPGAAAQPISPDLAGTPHLGAAGALGGAGSPSAPGGADGIAGLLDSAGQLNGSNGLLGNLQTITELMQGMGQSSSNDRIMQMIVALIVLMAMLDQMRSSQEGFQPPGLNLGSQLNGEGGTGGSWLYMSSTTINVTETVAYFGSPSGGESSGNQLDVQG